MDHNKLWKDLKEMRTSDHLTCILINVHAGQEATGRSSHRTTDCFKDGTGKKKKKRGKNYVRAVYFHPTYLTSMESTPSEIPGWMKL